MNIPFDTEITLGDPSRFAIRFFIYAEKEALIFGRLWLIVENVELGEPGKNIIMGPVVENFAQFVEYDRGRSHPRLRELSFERSLDVVMDALYEIGTDDIELEDVASYMEICPGLSPSFDGERAILMDVHEDAVLVYRTFHDFENHSITLKRGEVETVMREFIGRFKS